MTSPPTPTPIRTNGIPINEKRPDTNRKVRRPAVNGHAPRSMPQVSEESKWSPEYEPLREAPEEFADGSTLFGPAKVAEPIQPSHRNRRGGYDLPNVISAPDLMAKSLPPLRFAVHEILPVGYTVLAGPPKLGKSWLLLQASLAVAAGTDLFGYGTTQGEVLYLALEDGERRLQSRMDRLLGTNRPPAALSIATKWPRLDQGGMAAIETWAREHRSHARLCIIDTLQKIKPPASKAGNAYEQDYELHGQLHAMSHRLGIALASVTHMRKGSSGGDQVEAVMGSGGITGSADTIITLKRERGAADAFLSITGRDVQEQQLALKAENGVWTCLGSAQAVRMGETKKRLLAAVVSAGELGITPREAAEVAEVNHNLAKQTLRRMAEAGEITNLGGKYARKVL